MAKHDDGQFALSSRSRRPADAFLRGLRHTHRCEECRAAAAAAAAAAATRYSNSDTVLCTMIRVNAFARFSSMFTLGVAWPLGAADSAHTSTQ